MLVFVLTPVAGLVVCVVAHVALARAMSGRARVQAVLGSFLMGLVAVGMASAAFVQSVRPSRIDAAGYVCAWILTYLCLAHNYLLGFYNLSESARRIRLLIELHLAGSRGLSIEELHVAYNAEMIVESRLGRLLAGGQIVERDGRLYIGTPLVLATARMFGLLKLLFLGSRSEFGAREGTRQ